MTQPRGLALDRESVRSVSKDGHLHVAQANISKAAVNDYLGAEVPDGERLGLDPKKIYRLFRDPAELEKAASTFNNLPILDKHVPVTADAHRPDIVIGSTGTDAVFEAPYLKNSLVFWTADAIGDIETEDRRQLSCAYHYVGVLEAGTYEGQPYDMRMTEIVGNHVALVEEGRAGDDVVVGDEKPHVGYLDVILGLQDDAMRDAVLGLDAETKHDPSNGQFASGGGSGGAAKRKSLNSGGKPWLETKAGSGAYKPVKKHGVYEYTTGNNYHISNMKKDFDNERHADKHADALTAKTGKTHVARHNQYVDGARDTAMDSNLRNHPMPKASRATALSLKAQVVRGALAAYLNPKLAGDQRVDLKAVVLGTTALNYASAKPVIARRLEAATAGKLAKDANLKDVHGLLDRLDGEGADDAEVPGAEEVDPDEMDDNPAVDADGPGEAICKFLEGKVAPELLEEIRKMAAAPGGEDEDPEMMPSDKAKDAMAKAARDKAAKDEEAVQMMKKAAEAKDAEMKDMKKGMDASIKAAIAAERTRAADLREAEKVVRPWIGELEMAQDDASAVYRLALDGLGVNVKDVHPSAYRAILEAQPRPGQRPSVVPMANDAANKDFNTRLPDFGRLKSTAA